MFVIFFNENEFHQIWLGNYDRSDFFINDNIQFKCEEKYEGETRIYW